LSSVLSGIANAAQLRGQTPLPVTDVLADCTISATCAVDFQIFGYVSSQGHFSEDSTKGNYSLCCKNLANKDTGAVSFKYVLDSTASGEGHVSINSSKTAFGKSVKMGYPNGCYVADSCDLTKSEVCLFKVCNSYPACRLNNSNPYSIDNSLIADCNTPNVPLENEFTKSVCCKFTEICGDGIDNDNDLFIDCADEDCKQSATAMPLFCTGSPYNSDACVINYTLLPNGTIITNYNATCKGQDPVTDPPYYYCSYGKLEDPTAGNPGLCCQSGTYAVKDPDRGVWSCIGSAQCGVLVNTDDCWYDYDLNNSDWRTSVYSPTNPNWCQSKFPYYFTPLGDNMPYPVRSTGCCLIEYHSEVDYYTHPDNVKIFGYKSYCGDGIVDDGEECDGNNVGSCADNGAVCNPGYSLTGTPGCVNCEIVISPPYCNCTLGSNPQT